MATGDITSTANELKTQYPTGVWDDMWQVEAKYRARLKRSQYKASTGYTIKFPARIGGSWSVGVIADAAAFPVSDDPTRDQFTVNPFLAAGSFEISLMTKEVADNGQSTFESRGIMADRVESTARELTKYVERLYVGANRTRLGNVLAETGVNTFTLDKPLRTRLLNRGMRIDVYTLHSGGAVRDSMSNRRITKLDLDTDTLTYSGADQTVVAGDHVYITGSYAQDVMNLDDIIDDGTNRATYQGLSRTTYPELKATVLGTGLPLRNISEQLLYEACYKPRDLASRSIDQIYASFGQSQKALEFLSHDRRFPMGGEKDPKYSTGMGEDAVMIIAPGVRAKLQIHPDCRPRTVYLCDSSTFGHYLARDLDWVTDGDGGTMLKQKVDTSTGTRVAAFEAHMASIEQQINVMPIGNAKIVQLNDPLCGDA